jgi:hypothetical protein
MDRVEGLAVVVRHEVEDYVSPSPNATMYFMEEDVHQLYAAISIPHHHQQQVRIVVMAQVVGERVIIHEDITDRPLYEALVQAGVSRDAIILAYEGEEVPTK